MASCRMTKSANARNNLVNSRRRYPAGKTIEEVSHEMEVERFYRSFMGEKYFYLQSGKSSRKLCSKAVQTESDTSGIPPSYLILGQKLVDELYTGLGNMINTLYHTPNGYCRENAEKAELEPKNTKFCNYENGYWHSKLHPDIKMPAGVGVGRGILEDNFKKELYSLLEKAVKLKNALPYIIEIEQGNDPQPIENASESCEDKISRPEIVGVGEEVDPSEIESCSKQPGCSSDLPGRFDAHSVVNLQLTADSKKNECFQKTLRHDTKGSDPEFDAVSKYDLPQAESWCVQVPVQSQTGAPKGTPLQDGDSGNIVGGDCDNHGLVIIDGKIANFAKKAQPGSKGVSNAIAGCSNSSLKIKNAISVQAVKVESACNSNRENRGNEKGHNKPCKTDSSIDTKNFIKRNIMMASKMSSRATNSKSGHDKNSVSHETGQQAKRSKK